LNNQQGEPVATLNFNDVTKHKPYPIKTLKLYDNPDDPEADILVVENLMKDSNFTFTEITRPGADGCDRFVAYKVKITIYINRPDIIQYFENRSHAPISVYLELGNMSNIEGCGWAQLSIRNMRIVNNWASADSFLKQGIVMTAVTTRIEDSFSINT
jgi:hypothetical protein